MNIIKVLRPKLIPGKLYKTTIDVGLRLRMDGYSSIVIVPTNAILMFSNGEECLSNRLGIYYLYFLYEARTVYEYRYKNETYKPYWKELT